MIPVWFGVSVIGVSQGRSQNFGGARQTLETFKTGATPKLGSVGRAPPLSSFQDLGRKDRLCQVWWKFRTVQREAQLNPPCAFQLQHNALNDFHRSDSQGRWTIPLATVALTTTLGSSLPHGWNTGVLNPPQHVSRSKGRGRDFWIGGGDVKQTIHLKRTHYFTSFIYLRYKMNLWYRNLMTC